MATGELCSTEIRVKVVDLTMRRLRWLPVPVLLASQEEEADAADAESRACSVALFESLPPEWTSNSLRRCIDFSVRWRAEWRRLRGRAPLPLADPQLLNPARDDPSPSVEGDSRSFCVEALHMNGRSEAEPGESVGEDTRWLRAVSEAAQRDEA